MSIKPQSLLFFLLLFIVGVTATSKSLWDQFSSLQNNSSYLETATFKNFQKAVDSIKEERVYLHMDRPLYSPGDTIWFSAYLRDGQTLKNSAPSEILYVELINPKGSTEKTLTMIARDGQASGDFILGEDTPGGLYKIKAYTNNLKNDKSPAIFERELTVQKVVLPRLKMRLEFLKKAYGPGDKVQAELTLETNENKALSEYEFTYEASLDGEHFAKGKGTTDNKGTAIVTTKLKEKLKSNDGLLNILITYKGNRESISRSIPIVLNNIDIQFMPEGGELVSGLHSMVAFKALDEFGKPADIEGEIKDKKGTVITTFSSFHNGMGAFSFHPKEGEKYTASITKPRGVEATYKLPAALPAGYTLGIKEQSDSMVTLSIGSTKATTLSLIMQMRGMVLYSEDLTVGIGKKEIEIPVASLPSGVAQLTLFDSKGFERAERLVFLNRNKQLNIGITTDKEQYLPREKVQMEIQVTDDEGMPMPAQLSMAVVDDKLLAFMDDKSSTIQSWLLFESDIKAEVEEPLFYFDTTKENSLQALDYLMMTSGWRRFTWKEMREGKVQPMQFNPEKAVLAGRVINEAGEAVSGVTFIFTPSGVTGKTNRNGEFSFKGLDLSVPQVMYLEKGSYSASQEVQRYDDDLTLTFYKQKAIPKYAKRKNGHKFNNKPAAGIDVLLVDKMLDIEEQMMVAEDEGEFAEDEKGKDDEVEPVAEKRDDAFNLDKDEEVLEEKMLDREIRKIAMKKELRPRQRVVLHGQKGKVVYFRSRDFYTPVYDISKEVEYRTDFRSTIYWNGMVDVSANGKATIEFHNSDAITSFKTIVEGVNNQGLVGRAEYQHFTKKPLSLDAKLPATLISGDTAYIALQIENSEQRSTSANVSVNLPEALELLKPLKEKIMLPANKTTTLSVPFIVRNTHGDYALNFAVEAGTNGDAFEDSITVISQGFPIDYSFSGKELKASYEVLVDNLIEGSLNAKLTVYPTVVNDLMSGIESILREPSGCFEQTSMSSYPNTMILEHLRSVDNPDVKLLKKAERLLDKGYNRLTTFETSEKGYEWFGGAPGHEALTAYGLLQFTDMKRVSDKVDEKMIKRTSDWLMNRRDGKGGFQRNFRALDSYGGADTEITNAYIVYSLAEAGFRNIASELEHSYEAAQKGNDPYLTALVTNALFRFGDARADKMLASLMKLQQKSGAWVGTSHSITRSTGKGLEVETTSLVVMAAMLSKKADFKAVEKGVQYIVSSRSGYGGFGNTQSTVMALKALTRFANFAKKTEEPGTVEFYVNGRKVASKAYEAGEKDPIILDNLAKYLKKGKSKLTVKFAGTKSALPYALLVSYNTSLPNSAEECVIGLETELLSRKAKVGETVRLTTTVTNTTKKGQPMTVALVGIPAGLSAQPWQLKELVEKKKIDFYEITENMVYFYYRDMEPSEVSTINLDLKAELSGTFQATASSAYLYYTNEYKVWSSVKPIVVK